MPRRLDEAPGTRVVDGGSCKVLDDRVLRVFEVGKSNDGTDAPFGVDLGAGEASDSLGREARAAGRAGGGMSLASLLAVTLDRDPDERCMLAMLGKAGGMSSITSLSSSITTCASSGVEIDSVTRVRDVGVCGGNSSGHVDVSMGWLLDSSLAGVVPNHQARRYEVIPRVELSLKS